MMLYAAGIIYFVVIPLINRVLQPRPIAAKNKKLDDCSEHHHYATEVSTSWHQLYEALTTLVPSPAFGQPSQLLYGTISDLIVFAPFSRTWIKLFHGSNVDPVELSNAGAWVRLSELQCLGGKLTSNIITLIFMLLFIIIGTNRCYNIFFYLRRLNCF